MQIAGAILALILQLIIFTLLGTFIVPKKELYFSFSMCLITGFALYFTLFELIAVPLTILLAPLSVLTIIWLGIVIVLCITAIVRYRQALNKALHTLAVDLRKRSLLFYIAASILVLQIVFVCLYADNSADSAYYVGTVSTSVYTDTLSRFSAYTGKAVKILKARYLYSPYPFHNAVICKAFNIHPLIQTKLVMSTIIIILSNVVYCLIGKRLFPGKRDNAYLMVIIIFFVNIMFSSQYTASFFLLTRTYEGKTILANLLLPALFLACTYIWESPHRIYGWIICFIISVSGCAISTSSVFLITASLSALIIPYIIRRKKWEFIPRYFFCLSPFVIIGILYLLGSRGILVFYAN